MTTLAVRPRGVEVLGLAPRLLVLVHGVSRSADAGSPLRDGRETRSIACSGGVTRR